VDPLKWPVDWQMIWASEGNAWCPLRQFRWLASPSVYPLAPADAADQVPPATVGRFAVVHKGELGGGGVALTTHDACKAVGVPVKTPPAPQVSWAPIGFATWPAAHVSEVLSPTV
jgi:hypothetical protein